MSGIKYHEEALVGTYSSMDLNVERRLRQVEAALQPQQYRPRRNLRPNSNQRRDPVTVNVNLVGSHPSLGPPRFPRDDSVVSKGKSPEDVNARPCRHCGSPKHWDYECPHARKGAKQVKVNFANPDDGYTKAQEAYDALYYEDSDEEHTPEQDNNLAYGDTDEDQSGFCKPLQRETFSALHANPGMSEQGGSSRLGGSEDSTESSSLRSGDNTGMATTFRNRREKCTYWKQAMRAFVKNVVQDDLNPGSTIFM